MAAVHGNTLKRKGHRVLAEIKAGGKMSYPEHDSQASPKISATGARPPLPPTLLSPSVSPTTLDFKLLLFPALAGSRVN